MKVKGQGAAGRGLHLPLLLGVVLTVVLTADGRLPVSIDDQPSSTATPDQRIGGQRPSPNTSPEVRISRAIIWLQRVLGRLYPGKCTGRWNVPSCLLGNGKRSVKPALND